VKSRLQILLFQMQLVPLRVGIALLHRARAWGREAVAAGERVVARVNAATSGDAVERAGAERDARAAAVTAGGADGGAATVTELLHTAYLLDHLHSIDEMHAQFIGTITPVGLSLSAVIHPYWLSSIAPCFNAK
jgi:hypothetical protein